jgi:hypothetical protein
MKYELLQQHKKLVAARLAAKALRPSSEIKISKGILEQKLKVQRLKQMAQEAKALARGEAAASLASNVSPLPVFEPLPVRTALPELPSPTDSLYPPPPQIIYSSARKQHLPARPHHPLSSPILARSGDFCGICPWIVCTFLDWCWCSGGTAWS